MDIQKNRRPSLFRQSSSFSESINQKANITPRAHTKIIKTENLQKQILLNLSVLPEQADPYEQRKGRVQTQENLQDSPSSNGSRTPRALLKARSTISASSSHPHTSNSPRKSHRNPIQVKHLQFCIACKKPISNNDDHLRVDNKSYHKACLVCSEPSCKIKLGNDEFYTLGFNYFCANCYFEKEKKTCSHCKKVIRDKKFIRLHNNKYYHLDHFRCFKCGCNIVEASLQSEKAHVVSFHDDSKIEDSSENINSSTENSIEESIQEGDIVSRSADARNQSFKFCWFNGNPFCCDCFLKTGLRCLHCKEYIMDDYVDINGGTYHTYCVKCAKCGEVIEDYIVEEDGLFYHKDCYNEDFVKCDLCGAYIYDEYKYIFQGYNLHAQCYHDINEDEDLMNELLSTTGYNESLTDGDDGYMVESGRELHMDSFGADDF